MLVYYLVTALHVLVCVILILVVLLQSSKGADLAGAFGGSSTQTAFGSRGPASFLSKITIKKIQQEVEQKQKQDAATGQGAASGGTAPAQAPAQQSKPEAAKKP